MDIEKLIVNIRSPSWQDLEDPDATLLDDAADALSTLYAKYKSRDSLVDSLEDDVARLTEENEMLKEALKKYEVF